MEIWNNVLALLTLLALSSLARPRSLGRSPKRFFLTRTAQNTIRKNNDKKNDRLGSQSDGGHVF